MRERGIGCDCRGLKNDIVASVHAEWQFDMRLYQLDFDHGHA